MAKSALIVKQTLTDGDMSGDLTSLVTHAAKLDNIGFQVKWESSDITGTIAVEGSINYDPQSETGDWYALTFSPVLTQPNSDNGGYLVDVNQFPFPYYRVTFTNASGSTGTLNVWTSAKVLGG